MVALLFLYFKLYLDRKESKLNFPIHQKITMIFPIKGNSVPVPNSAVTQTYHYPRF